jgi:hypothetical protein
MTGSGPREPSLRASGDSKRDGELNTRDIVTQHVKALLSRLAGTSSVEVQKQ